MKILITGASGFLGKYVVAAALRGGHHVKAVVRPMTDVARLSWHHHANLELVPLDLRSKRGWVEALQGIDVVIHLAAVKAGDFYDQFAGTVIATENLLDSMMQVGVMRLIVTSTFSVYDYLHLKPGTQLDENSPIEQDPLDRDEYAQTKLIQENLVRQFEQEHGAKVTIIRPGMIYGRECLWHALLGAELGESRWLKIGGSATLPMTYVENCAEAIVMAIAAEAAVGATINIVDDELPTQNSYIQGLLKREDTSPKLIPVSWHLMKTISHCAWWVRQSLLGGKARLPGILVPAKLYARFNPLQYTNDRARSILQWKPRYGFEESLDRSYSSIDLLKIEQPDQALVQS